MSRYRQIDRSDGNDLKLTKPSNAGLSSLLKAIETEAHSFRLPEGDSVARPPRSYGRDSLLVALVEPMAGHVGHVGRVLAVRGSVREATESYFYHHFHAPDGRSAGGPRSLVLVGCAVQAGTIVSLSGQIVLRT